MSDTSTDTGAVSSVAPEKVPPSTSEITSSETASAPSVDAPSSEINQQLDKLKVDDGTAKAKGDVADSSAGTSQLIENVEDKIEKIVEDGMYNSATTFEELQLSPELLQGLYNEMKFKAPSRIQAETLPMILEKPYRNLIAQAHNGSGKTTCFTLGMLSRVDVNIKAPQALCLCPTRELVVQNAQVLEKMGKHTGITYCSTAVEATSTRREKIVDQIVVGTIGTVMRWLEKKVLDLRSMKVVVFDEADTMLAEDGFYNQSLRILKCIKTPVQMLLFSATFNENVKKLIKLNIPKALQVLVKKENLTLDAVKNYCVLCPTPEEKMVVLRERILKCCDKLGQTIVFGRTKKEVSRLNECLQADGWKCTAISSELDSLVRDRVIEEFRSGATKILIATDVLSRGFDLSTVRLVVNYDMPTKRGSMDPDYDTYMHRIHRAGRFGNKGCSFNLVCGQGDENILRSIEKYYDSPIRQVQYDDDDAFELAVEDAGLKTT